MSVPRRAPPSPRSVPSHTDALPAPTAGWSRRAALFGAAAVSAAPFLGIATPAWAAARLPAPPVDEALRDASLVEFRTQVIAIAHKRDVEALVRLALAEIDLGPNTGKGHALLREELKSNPGSWKSLIWALEHGGRFARGAFVAPYITHVAYGSIDPLEVGVVVSAAAPALAAPRKDARVVATIGHEVVRIVRLDAATEPPEGWYEIRTHDGKKAFVEQHHIEPLVTLGVSFVKRRNTWRIASMFAAD